MSDVSPGAIPTPDAPPPKPLGDNPPVHAEYVSEKPMPAGGSVSKEVRREEINQESPEGRPADAAVGSRGLRSMVLILGAVTFVIAIILGIAVSPGLGVALAGLGIVFMLINPTVGAALMRSKEREHVEDRHGEHQPRGT